MSSALTFHSVLLFYLQFHLIQGADLMSKHGINVPKGVAVGSLDEVKKALRDVFPNQSEVMWEIEFHMFLLLS